MKRLLFALATAALFATTGCHDNAAYLTCDGHGGIKSYSVGGDLTVKCKDGAVFNIPWI